jgi:general secretion pathway protein E
MKGTAADRFTAVPEAGLDDRLTALLSERGTLRDTDLSRINRIRAEQSTPESLPRLIVRLGVVSERDMAEALAELLGLPLAHTTDYPDVATPNHHVSVRFLKERVAVPIAEDEDKVVVAMADPQDAYFVSALSLACGKDVVSWVGVPSEIAAAIERLYGEGKSRMSEIVDSAHADERATEDDIAQLRDLASEAPVVRMVNLLIQRATEMSASDVHIEPFEDRLKVRYRIDGVLQEMEAPPSHFTAAVVSRIKLMANLNIAERRLPQDGRIRLRVHGRELDIRVSTVPTMHGESVVMRLLNKESVALDFATLGFAEDTLNEFLEVLTLPYGMILVTGPTGSGKTTTLYTVLNRLNTTERKIITVEDPVEYELEGINQIQIKPAIELTFANSLRSIVRQDPDVIMVGEMRDIETARICVQSALTGHLVLSTLHTNDAPSSVTRLVEMGVEDYLLTSTVNAVIAQRLVRVLCPACRQRYRPLAATVKKTGLDRVASARGLRLFRPQGCEQCNGSGYRGRTAILELMVMSDPIRQLVLQRADAMTLQREAIKQGMRTMYDDGLRKAVAGTTTLEEVIRVTYES